MLTYICDIYMTNVYIHVLVVLNNGSSKFTTYIDKNNYESIFVSYIQP